jgi:2'-5' RNA ligase
MAESIRPLEQLGRSIPPENLHLTLAFLGAVPSSSIETVRQIVAGIEVRPFDLILADVQWWQPQALLCWTPQHSEPLMNLGAQLHARLRSCEFALEERAFKPHVTLARDVVALTELKPISRLHWHVQRIDLIESQPTSTGSIYRVLEAAAA